jgi:hypothetical protein
MLESGSLLCSRRFISYNRYLIYPLYYAHFKEQYEFKTSLFFIENKFDLLVIHYRDELHNRAKKKVQHPLTRIEMCATLADMKIHLAIFLFVAFLIRKQT